MGEYAPTNNELLSVLDHNPDIRECVKLSLKYRLAGSQLAFVLYNAEPKAASAETIKSKNKRQIQTHLAHQGMERHPVILPLPGSGSSG